MAMSGRLIRARLGRDVEADFLRLGKAGPSGCMRGSPRSMGEATPSCCMISFRRELWDGRRWGGEGRGGEGRGGEGRGGEGRGGEERGGEERGGNVTLLLKQLGECTAQFGMTDEYHTLVNITSLRCYIVQTVRMHNVL